MRKFRRFLGYAVLAVFVIVLAILWSMGRIRDNRRVGGKNSETWLEILEEGDEAHKGKALDALLSRLEDPAESYPVLMILHRADLTPTQRTRVAARLTELLETDDVDPVTVIWTLGLLGPEAEVALPRLEELAARPLPRPDAHPDVDGWEGELEYAQALRKQASDSIRWIRMAGEERTRPDSPGWMMWKLRLVLVLVPALAVPLLFFGRVRKHTGEREHAARARLRWLRSASVVTWICRIGLVFTFLQKSGQSPWPWPLLGLGLLVAMILMGFAVGLWAQVLDQRLRGLGGSPWKNALPGFYFGMLQSSYLLVAIVFIPLGMFFVDGAGVPRVSWDVLATFFVVQGIVIVFGPDILRAVTSMEAPPGEKLTRVLERHSGQYRASSMLRAFDSGFVNAFVTIPGRRIVASDSLVTELSEPELDGIMCHELGHVQVTSETVARVAYLVLFSTLLCVGIALTPWAISWRGPIRQLHDLLPAGLFGIYLVALFFPSALLLRLSRRWETRADRFAVESCGDPAALASGLVKLHELGWLPMQFDAEGSERQTHPSLKTRLEDIYAHPRLAGASNPWARGEAARREMTLDVRPERLAICRLDPSDPVPEWSERGPFHTVTRTPDELSIVCSEDAIPETIPEGAQCERGWSCLSVRGPLAFTEVGILSSLTAPLAEAGISAFALSTFETDYILVRSADLDRALAALKATGHTIAE